MLLSESTQICLETRESWWSTQAPSSNLLRVGIQITRHRSKIIHLAHGNPIAVLWFQPRFRQTKIRRKTLVGAKRLRQRPRLGSAMWTFKKSFTTTQGRPRRAGLLIETKMETPKKNKLRERQRKQKPRLSSPSLNTNFSRPRSQGFHLNPPNLFQPGSKPQTLSSIFWTQYLCW